MKTFFVIIFLLHGLVHIMGFVKPVPSARAEKALGSLSFLSRISWFFAFGLLFFSAYLLYMENPKWWILGISAILFSQVLIILFWKDARWGIIPNIILTTAVLYGYADWQFDRNTKKIADEMVFEVFNRHELLTEASISHLPDPVQAWLRTSGVVGREKARVIRMEQDGWMKRKPKDNGWIETRSVQYFITDPPAFTWTVKMEMLPGLEVKGRDNFIDGKGHMQISALSLLNLVNEKGFKVDQASAQRYLSELCWFPSGAVSKYIHWQEIDSLTANATLSYKGSLGTVTFFFAKNGDVSRCEADRYMSRENDISLEKWQVMTKQMGTFNGIRIPVESEVTWKLKEGDFTWYRVRVKAVEYEPGEPHIGF